MNQQARIVALKHWHHIMKCAMEYEDPVLSMDTEVLHEFNALENHLEFNAEMVNLLQKFEMTIMRLETGNFPINMDDLKLDK